MEKYNFCLIKKNKLYEELYEELEDEDLIMDNINHKSKVLYNIEKLVKSYFTSSVISLSNTFSSSNDCLENIMLEIAESVDDNEKIQGNTLLIYADSENMFEVIFMEQLGVNTNDTELNQLASISNIELAPIYNNVAITKTSYTNNKITSELIDSNDILNIIINNFYHKGTMINCDKSTEELDFVGDNPNNVIGNNFKQKNILQLFGLHLVGYNEQSEKLNEIASQLYGEKIYGRLFITTLCPITNKRFWGLSSNMVQYILKLLSFTEGTDEQKNLIKQLNKEMDDNKLLNPFYLIKKYAS